LTGTIWQACVKLALKNAKPNFMNVSIFIFQADTYASFVQLDKIHGCEICITVQIFMNVYAIVHIRI
jgi:hypothetical protein